MHFRNHHLKRTACTERIPSHPHPSQKERQGHCFFSVVFSFQKHQFFLASLFNEAVFDVIHNMWRIRGKQKCNIFVTFLDFIEWKAKLWNVVNETDTSGANIRDNSWFCWICQILCIFTRCENEELIIWWICIVHSNDKIDRFPLNFKIFECTFNWIQFRVLYFKTTVIGQARCADPSWANIKIIFESNAFMAYLQYLT